MEESLFAIFLLGISDSVSDQAIQIHLSVGSIEGHIAVPRNLNLLY